MFIKYVEFWNYWIKYTHRKSYRKKTFCPWPHRFLAVKIKHRVRDTPTVLKAGGEHFSSGLSRVMARIQSKEMNCLFILKLIELFTGPKWLIMYQVLAEDEDMFLNILKMTVEFHHQASHVCWWRSVTSQQLCWSSPLARQGVWHCDHGET